MLETYLLEQFAAFGQYGTLLKASEELHITQPTLSRSMKKLEEEIGVPLFHRENSKLSLNETGKIALEYAKKALEANQDVINHAVSFDRSLRTVSIGSCAPFPINELMPVFQDNLPNKTLLTEIRADDALIDGLKNHTYNLVILHALPDDKTIFCQRYLDEALYISLPEDHPLSKKSSVTFHDLKGIRILMHSGVGFWADICKDKLDYSDMLIQNSLDALTELVEASALPVFNSDKMINQGYSVPGRVSVPISDAEAQATYWIACLSSEKNIYRSFFNAVRGSVLRAK